MMQQYTPLNSHNPNYNSKTWYKNNYMLSLPVSDWWYRITIGSGGRGKTYSARKFVLKNVKNKQRCFIWLRLTNQAVDNLLQNNAQGLFPPELLNKYKLTLKSVGNSIYLNDKLMGYVCSIQGYHNNKGQENPLPDYSLKHTMRNSTIKDSYFDVIADELIREATEKNTFDIKHAFQNQIENFIRRRKNIRVLIYANFLNEITDIEELFDINLIPGKFGIYKNIKTHTVIEYLPDSDEWKAEQRNTYAGVLNVQSGRFTNKPTTPNRLIIYQGQLRGQKVIFNIHHKQQGLNGPRYTIVRWKDRWVVCFFSANRNKHKTYALTPSDLSYGSKVTYNKDIIRALLEKYRQSKLHFTSFLAYKEFAAVLSAK